MGSVNLRFASFGVRGLNRTVTGGDTQLVDVGGAGGAPNRVDASSSESGNGTDSARAELSTTGIDRSTFNIGGATTGTLDLQLFNSSRVRASSSAQTGSSTAGASYRASTGTPNAFTPSRINGGVIQSRFSTGGNSYITSGVGFNATATAASGGFATPPSTGTASVDSAEGYGWYNSDLSANRTDATAAPAGLDGLGGLLEAGVESSFAATATMAGTGNAVATSAGDRQVGISNRPLSPDEGEPAHDYPQEPFNIRFGFDGAATASESTVIVDGAAVVTNAATASANSGSTLASAGIAGVAGILNDYLQDEDDEDDVVSGDFAITINAAFGDVAGAGNLANTASATSANGSSTASAQSQFVGGVIDVLQVVDGLGPVTPDGSFNIEFGLDGVVQGVADADSAAIAFSGDGGSSDDTSAAASNIFVTGVSVNSIQFDRHGELITEAVNRETATATTSRSGAGAVATAGGGFLPFGSRTTGLRSTDVNAGGDLYSSGLNQQLSDPLFAQADARGEALASSVSNDATATAASNGQVFGIDNSLISAGGAVVDPTGLGTGLLAVNAYQAYSATASATSAAGSGNAAAASASAGDDDAHTKGIAFSAIDVGAGHLAAFATNVFEARATTTDSGAATARTDHGAVGIDDASVLIGGGEEQASFEEFVFSGVLAQAQSRSAVAAISAGGAAAGLASSTAHGIRLDANSQQVQLGVGDVQGYGYLAVAGLAAGDTTATLDASYAAVGIKTAVDDSIEVLDQGSIVGEASIYGSDALEEAFGDPGMLVAAGEQATTTVDLPEVSGILDTDDPSASPITYSYTAGANGGDITGTASVLLNPEAYGGGGGATVNLGVSSAGDLVTGIRTANLNLGASGLTPGGRVRGEARITTESIAAAAGAAAAPTSGAAINRNLTAIGLLGKPGSRIQGASLVTANAQQTSLTSVTGIHGAATVSDVGSSGGLLDYTTYTFGNGSLNAGASLNAVARATSFTFNQASG